MALKRGRWTKYEMDYIAKHYLTMSLTDIAEHLERTPKGIERYLQNHLPTKMAEQPKYGYDITTRPFWINIKQQFSPDEQKMFIFHWGEIVKQFRDDVLPTEEWQIIDVIKINLLLDRLLTEKQSNILNQEELDGMIDKEKEEDIPDADRIFNWITQIAGLRGAQESIDRRYKDFLIQKNNLLEKLKATRADRVKVLENAKHNIKDWLKRIISDKDMRTRLGFDMERMRLAMYAEKARLTEYHEYQNKEVDQPFLTPDTVKDDNK